MAQSLSVRKGNSKFEILLVKIFSPKQKLYQVLLPTIKKIKFCLAKNNLMFIQTITSSFV